MFVYPIGQLFHWLVNFYTYACEVVLDDPDGNSDVFWGLIKEAVLLTSSQRIWYFKRLV